MATVGITPCRALEDYEHAIRQAGGVGRVLTASPNPAATVEGLDGLVLTGGEDVDPALFGEARHPAVVRVNPERDAFEIALAREARARRLPVLAICRGIQVLNVACGGTLIQDIPSEVTSALTHRLPVPLHQPTELAHPVRLRRNTLLERIMADRLALGDRLEVNSRHHQAVKRVANGFDVSATAPDGVIEAIEDPAATFCVGVQWHPESFWRTGEFSPLFTVFVHACSPAG